MWEVLVGLCGQCVRVGPMAHAVWGSCVLGLSWLAYLGMGVWRVLVSGTGVVGCVWVAGVVGDACGGGSWCRGGLLGAARCGRGPTLVSVNAVGLVGRVWLGSARVVGWRVWRACAVGGSEQATRLSPSCAAETRLLQLGPILVSVRGDMQWQLRGLDVVRLAGWSP